jgi:alpha-L-rhamnosidase
MDHVATWDALVSAAQEAGLVADEAELATRLERYLDRPAHQLVEAISPRDFSPSAEALQERLDALLES